MENNYFAIILMQYCRHMFVSHYNDARYSEFKYPLDKI